MLREYITESDEDNMFMWGRIAKKLNRSELACKYRMRKILDCGIYGEEKEGELTVFCIVSTLRSIDSSVVCYVP
jgi:predicted transcriptional regulator